ncbi:MAG: P-loop NTPase [Microbacterium sp.]
MVAALAADGLDARAVPAALPGHEADAALRAEPAAQELLPGADALVLEVSWRTFTHALVSHCDRLGIRIVPLAGDADAGSLAAMAGLAPPLPLDADGWRVVDAVVAPTADPPAAAPAQQRGSVVVVWGPAGAPGRSTVATALAAELSRGGRRVALVDADSHAPSLALALGLADEGPGFAAACRQTDRDGLDLRELDRISAPLRLGDGVVHVLTGINRPSRWPELTEGRVTAALDVCRDWADFVVVDVAAPLERDEEIVSDLDGPRRNAATLAALRTADLVVAILSADPLGASRFVRGYAELRATVGATPVAVAANRLRPGALGLDPRGQVRRALDRFAGIPEVAFLPLDPRSADAAMLSARPIAEVAPKSPFTLAVRRLAATCLGLLPASAGSAPAAALPAVGDEAGDVAGLPRRQRRRPQRRSA